MAKGRRIPTGTVNAKLQRKFTRIKKQHRKALRLRAARASLVSSVTRVFKPSTRERLICVLARIDVDSLPGLRGPRQFKEWFERALSRVAATIRRLNAHNTRVNPGYKWGHATKVLALYVRSIVLDSRYFTDSQAQRIRWWLYAPIDRVVIRDLTCLGMSLPFKGIKDIHRPARFYKVQDALGAAAAAVGVPRVWFDDRWAQREKDARDSLRPSADTRD